MATDPFHEGERLVQHRTGETLSADSNSPMISSQIPAAAIPFLAQQSLLVLGLLDRDRMWCVPVVGSAGWLSATRHSLHLNLQQTIGSVDERILRAAGNRQLVGAIALDFATRRRLRMNGRLEKVSNEMVLTIVEAYPNCPKYITQRELLWTSASPQVPLLDGDSLGPLQRAAIAETDIVFIASQHPQRGLDASHRGGNPGFVTTTSDKTIRIPDYPGNSLFNTLGNLEIDSRAGLLIPGFANGSALEITGTASVSYEDHGRTRWMTITVQHWRQAPLPVIQKMRNLSPFNP